jgi:hypothetical protein
MESVVEPATLRTQIESVTQAILETNMLCRPTTLVSVVSETRLARPQTRFRITIHCSLNGIAERSCASSDTAHAAQKQNASDRKTDMLCRPTTLVSIVSEMRLARKNVHGEPFESTASSTARIERSQKKRARLPTKVWQKATVAHQILCHRVHKRS